MKEIGIHQETHHSLKAMLRQNLFQVTMSFLTTRISQFSLTWFLSILKALSFFMIFCSVEMEEWLGLFSSLSKMDSLSSLSNSPIWEIKLSIHPEKQRTTWQILKSSGYSIYLIWFRTLLLLLSQQLTHPCYLRSKLYERTVQTMQKTDLNS